MRHLKKTDAPRYRNSLWMWAGVKNPFRVALNFLLIEICKYLPSLRLKNFLYRLIGIKIGKNAAIGLAVQFDIFYPELIYISENALIGYNTTILAHEFLQNELRTGKVAIGKNVLIGACTVVLPGVEIGDGAVVSALSLVNNDIPKNSFYGGIPARRLKRS